MKRFGPGDFGYNFVGYDPPNSAVAVDGNNDIEIEAKETADEDENQSEETPFVYKPPRSMVRKMRARADGEGDDSGQDGTQIMAMVLSGFAACCCLLTAVFVAVGGILFAHERYKDEEDSSAFAGSIVLVLAAAASICGCCSMCVGCCSSAVPQDLKSMSPDPGGSNKEVRVKFRRLNDRYEKAEEDLNDVVMDVVGGIKEVKAARKKELEKKKEEEKKDHEELTRRVVKDIEAGLSVSSIRRNYRPVVFFIRFEGDLMVSGMELLRQQVSHVVKLGRPGVDLAVVAVTSPGGGVSQYGLAASQLVRIRKAGIQLVVCVDMVAASGGYMMASVADKILAAPFAIVGSIGVVTQIPNFQRFLDKQDIDAYLFTAGKYKRTVDMIGEVTEEGKAKLQEELDAIHMIFQDHISLARPKLKETIEAIATGEHWLAVQAKEKGLVDEIMTSDEYLESLSQEYDIIQIMEKKKKKGMIDLHGLVRTTVETIRNGATTLPQPNAMPMAV